MKETDPKDELGKLELAALRFKCTRATPLLLVRPPPGSHICVSMSEVSVTMRSIVWGVGELNTQTGMMSNNQDMQPLYAREALVSELGMALRERILALRVDLMDDAVFESDETSWEIKSTNPETGEEEFVLMRGNIEIRLGECDEDALQKCLSNVASSAQRRFGIRLEHQGREEIRIIDAWQTLLRHPRSAHSASARAMARAPRECSLEQCRRGCSNFEERSVARSRLPLEMIPAFQLLLSQEKNQCRAAQMSHQRTLKYHNNGHLHRCFFLPATADGMARPRLR